MAEYSKEEIKRIEDKWREKWENDLVYKTSEDPSKPKYYVLDMFPYPSGAGLHVGHPLGYIASDIVARFKQNKGFNVLHPMGFDAFGLPAEQYAIQTGQHPAITTAKNIETFKNQLVKIGLSFDWDREVQTSDPDYYKWTQWIFMQLFNAWYNKKSDKTERIELLIAEFEKKGNKSIDAATDEETPTFSAAEWKSFDEMQKENALQKYRIAYRSETMVNWCAALGTVLSNDEVKDGVSERGGYPVERIKMLQWSMRISAFAERLLAGLNTIDWPEPLKEMQRNWIGKSEGAKITFAVKSETSTTATLIVFTTRPDTIFGVDFMVVAPEHEMVKEITSKVQRQEVDKYLKYVESRSEVDRLADVKKITGCFTGAYAINPFNKREIPIWTSEYVLAGYGTGAIMAVPCGDERDHKFAKHFNLPITNIIGRYYNGTDANPTDEAILENSDFLNGIMMKDAIPVVINKLEGLGIGVRKVNYRMRDAIFGRQRYWGEPFPVYFKDGIPKLVDVKDLPITLPEIDEYKPTESGEPPLARAKGWRYRPGHTNPGLTPGPSPGERGRALSEDETSTRGRETANKSHWHKLASFSKENRINPTEAESILWKEVRNRKLGFKIRRQHAIGDFVADFVCLDKRLVIEVDGDYHKDYELYDQARTEFLKSEGFDVIRFTNDEVKTNLSKVLTEIKTTLEKSLSLKDTTRVAHSSPLPRRGEGGEAFSNPGEPFELTTMPGWAGSSWYWYRYMDPHNDEEFCSREKESYWKDVDLYIGGSEHATGHLLYSRFWNKALKDLGYVDSEEPFKKLINQGHIQGVSKLAYRINGTNKFVSYNLRNNYEVTPLHVDISFVDGDVLDIEKFKAWRDDLRNVELLLEDGKYICGSEVDKMSKRYFNVVNPDDIIEKYGADTLRLYEMFLGPLEQSKPWNTNGIDGVYKFLRRFWNLFHDDKGNWNVSSAEPTRAELKVLHKTLKKVEHDIENFSFNTSVSEFMICANELTPLKCNKRAVLEPLVIALSPFAPHLAEELWSNLGHPESILKASFVSYDEQYLKENSFEYPISINGKVRTMMNFALDMPKEDIEKMVLASEIVKKWSEGKPPKKVIIVQGKIVNVVL